MAFGLTTTGLQMVLQIVETIAKRRSMSREQNLMGA
jgi:hypothetical protein